MHGNDSNVLDAEVFLSRFFDERIQLRVALLSLPGPWTALVEHFFDLFEGLAACFGISVPIELFIRDNYFSMLDKMGEKDTYVKNT